MSLLLCFIFKQQTEDIHERVAIGDREFLINARLGAAVKQYHLECLNNQISPPKSSIKKPFDWMSDTQYQHLLVSLCIFLGCSIRMLAFTNYHLFVINEVISIFFVMFRYYHRTMIGLVKPSIRWQKTVERCNGDRFQNMIHLNYFHCQII